MKGVLTRHPSPYGRSVCSRHGRGDDVRAFGPLRSAGQPDRSGDHEIPAMSCDDLGRAIRRPTGWDEQQRNRNDCNERERHLRRQGRVRNRCRKRHGPYDGAGLRARRSRSVVLADVSDEGNQDTARMIEELGGRALAVRCDVTRSEDVQAALNQAVDALGRFDVAFNNAGASRQRRRLDAQRLPDQCRLPRDRRHGDDAPGSLEAPPRAGTE